MSAVLLDTHAWAWSLTGDPRLSDKAISAMRVADSVFISPISLFEIGQKVRIGEWPEIAPHVEDLPALLESQGGRTATLTSQISLQPQSWRGSIGIPSTEFWSRPRSISPSR